MTARRYPEDGPYPHQVATPHADAMVLIRADMLRGMRNLLAEHVRLIGLCGGDASRHACALAHADALLCAHAAQHLNCC